MVTNSKSRESVRALTESAILVALGVILSHLVLFRMPQGGSVTPFAMLPVIVIGIRHGLKWGLGSGFVFACLQMIRQFWPPPTGTLEGYIAVVMLDYIIAYSVLGLSGLFKGKKFGLIYAIPMCIALRFLSHFVSGLVVWNIYAGEQPVWLYSLIYNGSYMGVELVITTAVGAVLCTALPMLFNVSYSQSESAPIKAADSNEPTANDDSNESKE